MKFSSSTDTSVQRCLYPLFQNQRLHFCCPLFFEEYLNPQVRITKIVNEHTVDYHPSPSGLTSRIHPLKFLCFYCFSVFMFQIYGVKITRKYICKSKKWICSFLLTLLSKVLPQVRITPKQKQITHFSRTDFFEIYFPTAERGKDYGAEKMTIIKPFFNHFTHHMPN